MPMSKFSRKEHKARAMLLGMVHGQASNTYKTGMSRNKYTECLNAETIQPFKNDREYYSWCNRGNDQWRYPDERSNEVPERSGKLQGRGEEVPDLDL